MEVGGEGLTQLGRHLAALPLPPRVGKLILYGVLFRCLDPVLTIACAMSYRYSLACAIPDNKSLGVLQPSHSRY